MLQKRYPTVESVQDAILARITDDDAVCSRPGWVLGPCWKFLRENGHEYNIARNRPKMRALGENLISRLSYRVFVTNGEPIPDDIMVCHHCDNPSCVNPKHLFMGDAFDNYDDARAKGRMKTRHGTIIHQ